MNILIKVCNQNLDFVLETRFPIKKEGKQRSYFKLQPNIYVFWMETSNLFESLLYKVKKILN